MADKGADSSSGKGKGKSKPHPTGSRRNRKQKVKASYAKAREEAQLLDIIPTTPEGAVRPERVDPATQADVAAPELIGQAIRNGWAVPEARKPDLVDELIRILDSLEAPDKVKVAAFNALRMADQAQYERDHPEVVAKLRGNGATVNVGVSVQSNMDTAAIIRQMVLDGELGLFEEMPSSHLTGTPSISGQQRSVDTSATSEVDKQRTGNGVENAK